MARQDDTLSSLFHINARNELNTHCGVYSCGCWARCTVESVENPQVPSAKTPADVRNRAHFLLYLILSFLCVLLLLSRTNCNEMRRLCRTSAATHRNTLHNNHFGRIVCVGEMETPSPIYRHTCGRQRLICAVTGCCGKIKMWRKCFNASCARVEGKMC